MDQAKLAKMQASVRIGMFDFFFFHPPFLSNAQAGAGSC
jgi:hypothetical protein